MNARAIKPTMTFLVVVVVFSLFSKERNVYDLEELHNK